MKHVDIPGAATEVFCKKGLEACKFIKENIILTAASDVLKFGLKPINNDSEGSNLVASRFAKKCTFLLSLFQKFIHKIQRTIFKNTTAET